MRHGPAGCLMGFGDAIALGGDDSHSLLGLPTLSFASIVTVLIIMNSGADFTK